MMEDPAMIITSHDDDINIYLTIYSSAACARTFRSSAGQLTNGTFPRCIAPARTLSCPMLQWGPTAIMNLIDKSTVLMVAEGLDVFRVKIPDELAGRTLAEARVREETDCTVVALKNGGEMDFDFSPHMTLPADVDLIVIGTAAAEKQFMKVYG
jgi:voltage-gated potassium channel